MRYHIPDRNRPRAMARVVAMLLLLGLPAAHANLKTDAAHAGHDLGVAGRRIGRDAKRVGLAIGHAAKAGGLAFWHAIHGKKH